MNDFTIIISCPKIVKVSLMISGNFTKRVFHLLDIGWLDENDYFEVWITIIGLSIGVRFWKKHIVLKFDGFFGRV